MKKITNILLFIFAILAINVNAQIPIPSWNTIVTQLTNFQELQTGTSSQTKNNRGKRVLHIDIKRGTAAGASCATARVYSIDGLDVLGPYQICVDEPLSVDIDDRTWGVLIESETQVVVDVWIE